MSRDNLEDLLQECLAAHDAGLTPEECLSAWPQQRAQLEPLLRQALRLRIAFTASPRPEFRANLKERVLFAAGRDVIASLSSEADPVFVARTRGKLRYAAGESTQEALRAVAPPRLGFWMNARRRLLESAAAQALAPAPRPMAMTMRTALSAAVVVLAMAVAGLAYITAQPGQSSAGAEYASIDQRLQEFEQQRAAGAPIATAELLDLSRRTAAFAEKITTDPAAATLAIKVQPLIDRQKEVVGQAVSESAVVPPALQEVQQQLSQAEDRIKVFAARADTPEAVQSTIAPAASVASPVPTLVAATPVPATTTAVPSATPEPVKAGQVRSTLLVGDTTFGLTWRQIDTSTLSFAVPASWTSPDINFDAQGLAALQSNSIRIDGPNSTILIVSLFNGSINALVGGEQVTLRGPNGSISVEELLQKAGPMAPQLSHILETLEFTATTPSTSPTQTPAASPTTAPTSTVTPTSTAVPATPVTGAP